MSNDSNDLPPAMTNIADGFDTARDTIRTAAGAAELPAYAKVGTASTALQIGLHARAGEYENVFTQPGNPQQNAYVERFNRTVRYECLNQHLFRELSEVQDYTTAWQHFYNHERPHMSVNGEPPHFKQ